MKRLLVSILSAGLLSIPVSAFAAPDASAQGGADGVLFMTEASDGAIYVGDFKNPPTEKSIYWQEAGSKVDEVAVTATRVAWSSLNSTSGGTLFSKVFISNVGKKAGEITSVTIPGNSKIRALGADYFNERFYVITAAGELYSFKSDGTDIVLGLSDAVLSNVSWGLWVDSYNSKIYFCDQNMNSSQSASYGTLWSATYSGSTVSAKTTLKDNFLPGCDGLGVDPVTQVVYGASYNQAWKTFDTSTNTEATLTITGHSGNAPSSMFVSHSTSKIYFTTETNVYEVNYNGSDLRSLYTGSHTAMGFENIAVYYGQTLDTIDNVAPSSSSKPTLSSGSTTPTGKVGSKTVETYKASTASTWAITGGKNSSLFSIDSNGVLTFKKAPTKAGTYLVEIQATNSAGTKGDVIKITVTVKATLAATGANAASKGLLAAVITLLGTFAIALASRKLRLR